MKKYNKNNSICKNCRFFHRGVKVAHNHCDYPHRRSIHEDRVNGRIHKDSLYWGGCSDWQEKIKELRGEE